jgi:hypothetical protein
MRVYIGPYRSWIGPYQIADWLQHIGFSEDKCQRIGEWLSKTRLNNVCQWIDNKKHRNVKIKYHNYDTWNLDHTLAHIILPGLKQLKEIKHGVPSINIEDVPEELRFETTTRFESWPDFGELPIEYKVIQWDWIMDEMIWTFDTISNDDVSMWEYDNEQVKRVENGLRLFGKYYLALWD